MSSIGAEIGGCRLHITVTRAIWKLLGDLALSMSLGRLKQAQFFCLVGIDIIIIAILFLDIQEILELCLARNVFYQEISGLHRD